MQQPRFVRPVDCVRPYGSHRYDLYGLKAGRRLTLFGRDALQGWLRLETDCEVLGYCERPIRIPDTRPARTVDFWVRKRDAEYFWILLRHAEARSVAAGNRLFTAFEAWTNAHAIEVRVSHSEDLHIAEPLRSNWMTMLQYLAANRRFLVAPILSGVLGACGDGMTVSDLERRFATIDPMLVRTAAFELMLRGSLQCSTLASAPLAGDTVLVPQ